MSSMYLLLYFIAHDPVSIFKTHLADVVDAIEASYLPIANGLYAKNLLSSSTRKDVASMRGSHREKADIIAESLLQNLERCNNQVEFLMRICEFFTNEEDRILYEIGAKMIKLAGMEIYKATPFCNVHVHILWPNYKLCLVSKRAS